MSALTVSIHGINLDIEYNALVERDGFGTGDSPTTVDISVNEIICNGINIYDLVNDSVLEEIEAKLIDDELEEARYVA